MNERNMQQKYQIQTAKMHRSVIRHKMPQAITDRCKTLQNAKLQYEYWVGYFNEQSMALIDNKAATVIPGHYFVAVSTKWTSKLLYF